MYCAFALTACATVPRDSGERGPAAVPQTKFAITQESEQSYLISVPPEARVRIKILSPHSFRVLGPSSGTDNRLAEEFMVVFPDRSRPVVSGIVFDAVKGTIATAEMTLNFSAPEKSVLRIVAKGPKKTVIDRWDLHLDSKLPMSYTHLQTGEHIYGFGDKRASLDQRGQVIEMLNHDAFASENNDSYKSIPFYVSSGGYGLFFHNFYRSVFNVGATDKEWLSIRGKKGDLDFYVFLGTPKEVVSQYSELTGRPQMLPHWFFGYHQGRAAYKGRDAYEVAKQMRARNLPVDSIYYDDWIPEAAQKSFTSPLWNDYHILLTMGGNPFVIQSEHPELLNSAAAQGFLMVDENNKPAIEPAQEINPGEVSEENAAKFNAGYVDFFSKPAAQLVFKTQWEEPLKNKVRIGMWDFGEMDYFSDKDQSRSFPSVKQVLADVRNIYPLVYAKRMFDAQRELSGERPTGMVRAGFAGSQRFGWTTTCDSEPTFQNFRAHLRALINLTLSGYSSVGYDIGGWNKKGPDDVYARWFAAGTFNPFMWAHGTGEHEPYSHGPKVEAMARSFLDFRYRMIPTFYSLHELAHRTGVPILRSFPMQENEDPRSSKIDDEFFVGDTMLVAPVLSASGSRSVYLPKGDWYDFFGEQETVTGPIDVSRKSISLNRIPVYIRAGGILVLGPKMQYSWEKPEDPLTVEFFSFSKQDLSAGPRTSDFDVYEDDGLTFQFLKGEFQHTNMHFVQGEKQITFAALNASGTHTTQHSYWIVLKELKKQINGVFLDGNAVPYFDPNLTSELPNGAYWQLDKNHKAAQIFLPSYSAQTLLVETGA